MQEHIRKLVEKQFFFELDLEKNPRQTLRKWYEESIDEEKRLFAWSAKTIAKAGKAGLSMVKLLKVLEDSESFNGDRALIHERLGRPNPPQGWKCQPECD